MQKADTYKVKATITSQDSPSVETFVEKVKIEVGQHSQVEWVVKAPDATGAY